MSTNLEHGMISRYTDQPVSLPAWLREQIEKAWDNQPVQLYALTDLDASMRFSQAWIALGPERIAIARERLEPAGTPVIHSFERSRIRAVREKPGLSCTTLTVLGEPDDPPLAVLRYTHRQRRTMGNLKFVIEQQLSGQAVEHKEPDLVYADSVVQVIKEAQATVATGKYAVVTRLLSYLAPYRRRLALGMLGATCMTLVTLIPAYLTGKLIDQVIRPFQGGTLPHAVASHLAWLCLLGLGATYLTKEFFAWVRFRTMSMLGEYVARDLRNELYEHLQKLSVSYFSSKQTGSIISRVGSDTDRIWDFIAFGVVEVSISVIMLAGLGTMLISLDWKLGLIMTAPVPVLLWAIYLHGQRMQAIFLRVWRKWSSLTDVLSDTIPGIRVVKAFNQESQEVKRFYGKNDSVTGEFNRVHRTWTSFWPVLMLSIHAVMLTVWTFALPRVLSTDQQSALSAGTFVSFLLYMTMFIQPIEVIGQMARMLNRATSSAHRIFELLDTRPTIVDVEEPVRLEPVRGRITFENVTFAYDGIRPVLKGVTLDVQPGEMIGLVGPSGGGKTTLINLIARFYEASTGKILIDGVDIRKLDTGHFRRQVGMVLQDPYLFHGTILDNIRYGLPEASIDEIVEAARMANAHGFIGKLPHGYDTIVGERGHTLSGGERQRVSIARAILHDPRILILDEATSSVDTETERRIQEALDRLVKGRTVFAIAHRLSTLTKATRLIAIENGRIAEQGTHAELLARENGVYSKLHRLQRELHEIYAL